MSLQGKWTVLLTDRFGFAIANITSICESKQYVAQLNRPAQFSFQIKSDDARVATLYSDGYPMLNPLNRGVRAYRSELQSDGSYKNILRFSGHVWQLQDQGDADHVMTSVVAFDPLQMLNKRLFSQILINAVGDKYVWSTNGSAGGGGANDYSFSIFKEADAVLIAQAAIDVANERAWTGVTSTIATTQIPGFSTPYTGAATNRQTIHIERQMIGDVISLLASTTSGFDYSIVPDETAMTTPSAVFSGYTPATAVKRHGYFKTYYPKRGTTQTKPLGFACPPNNVAEIDYAVDGQSAVNMALGVGSGGNAILALNDPASITGYGLMEGVLSYPNTNSLAQLSKLLGADLGITKKAAATFSLRLQAKSPNAALPWDNFDLGDTLPFYIGARVRGGTGATPATMRIYDYTLNIDNDGGESVDSLTGSTALMDDV